MSGLLWVAEQDVFQITNLRELEATLEAGRSVDCTDIKLVIPDGVWTTPFAESLSALYSRYSDSFVSEKLGEAESIELSPKAVDAFASATLARLLFLGEWNCFSVLSIRPEVLPFQLRGVGVNSVHRLHRVPIPPTADELEHALDQFQKFESCRGKVLVVIGGGAKKSAGHICKYLPFDSFKEFELSGKGSPSKAWRARVEALDARQDTFMVATSRVGHAHTESLACHSCSRSTPQAMLLHVCELIGLRFVDV